MHDLVLNPSHKNSTGQDDEDTARELKSSVSDGLVELLRSLQQHNVSEIINTLGNYPEVHFTGYADIRSENDFKWVVRCGNIVMQACGDERSGYELIVVDIEKKELVIIWTSKSIRDKVVEMDLSRLDKNGVVDLNNIGCYWEGGMLNGCECCGYGKEYNDENNVVYEGFMFGGQRVCYGREYRGIRDNTNNNTLLYEGEYWNGVRYGIGKSYELNGNVEYEGEWIDNLPKNELDDQSGLLKSEDHLLLLLSIEEIVIGNHSYNDREITSLHFSSLFNRLRRVEIGGYCFQNAREFVLAGLERLESVKIGYYCFRSSYERYSDGVCRITNCPKLTQLEIRGNGFQYFTQFELSNVKSLQSITFGGYCFKNVREFVLDGMEKLESVKIDSGCFGISGKRRDDGVCRIANCPYLHQLEIANFCFEDFKRFELSNVNSLRSIQFGDYCISCVREFVLDGLEQLESLKISYGPFSSYGIRQRGQYDGVCRIVNCPSLIQLEFGKNRFTDFNQFELSNVNSLQSIQFGDYCFQYAENCILKGE